MYLLYEEMSTMDNEDHIKITKFTDPNAGKKVIIILDGAHLQLVQRKPYVYELANTFKHKNILKEQNIDIKECRPDIVHQCLIHLLDSPLNQYGMLQIYIRTQDHQLIYVSPHLQIPRTFKQFESLMVTLLRRFNVKAKGKNIFLLKLLKNDLNLILPDNGKKIALSTKGKQIQLTEYISQFKELYVPVTFFIGAVAHSNPTMNVELVHEQINISEFSLSAACCCSTLCSEFENLWNLF